MTFWAKPRQMCQELFDLVPTHFLRMTLAVEKDEAAHPGNLRLFGAIGVMLGPQHMPQPIEQFGRLRRLRIDCPVVYGGVNCRPSGYPEGRRLG
jgi:hypothetical protein